MIPLFWGVVALDFTLFVILVILGMASTGPSDGGREMSMIFFVIVPAVIIGSAVLLFVKSESSLWRTVALIIVAGPGLILAGTRVRDAYIRYQIRQNSAGSGYFSGRALKNAAEAVVRGDVAAINALDRSVDINAKGEGGKTLIELAVAQTVLDSTPSPSGPSRLDVVRALIARGADPNNGLEEATRFADGAALQILLDAGAKPGFADDRGPVAFRWLNIMSIGNFTALLDRGMDVNLKERDDQTLLVASAENDRWNFVLLLMDRGADALRDAKRLGELVQSREESTSARPAEMMADIARVKARLAALRPESVSR